MTSEMVEKGARTIYEDVMNAIPGTDWDNEEEDVKRDYRQMMRVAIRVLREPTEAMLKAGFLANVWTNPNSCDKPGCISRVTMPFDKAWIAALDAA